MSNTNNNLQTQISNALHNAIMKAGGKDRPPIIHLSNSNGLKEQFQLQKVVQKPLQKGIDNDIYSTVDACPNTCEMWKAIARLKQGESINVQDFETNLYWKFEKFTSIDGETIESYYSRFYKMMNELRLRFDLYMAKIQEVNPDVADISGPIFDTEPLQKVNQDDDDLAKERDLFTSLLEKLKYEIDDSKNRNKFLESSNKTLIDKLKGEIENFKTKNKSLKLSNNHFKEANKELSKTNQLMFKDLKKFQAELDRYHDVNYASKVETDCAKAKGDLVSYKMESQKSLSEHTRKIII
ncbi:hypothetical protein Tco_0512523 [Tanacetum coccineum]